MKKKKYVAPEITVIEMESSQIMAGSNESVRGWTPDDMDTKFDIVEEGDDDYSDGDF